METTTTKNAIEEAKLQGRLDTAKANLADLDLEFLADMLDDLKEYNEAGMELSAFRIAQETGMTREKVLERIQTQPHLTAFPNLQDGDAFDLSNWIEGLKAINLVRQDVAYRLEPEDEEDLED